MMKTPRPRVLPILFAPLLALAALAGCTNNEPLAREKAALEAEWLPFWKGECGQLYDQLDPWLAKNAARIKDLDARWEALSQGERDSLVDKLEAEFGPIYSAEIEITIRCGLGPMRYRKSPPGK
jgi:hypothetical protein